MTKLITFLMLMGISTSSAFAAKTVKWNLGTGTTKDKEAMVYSQTAFTVKVGTTIELTFKNNSASQGMQHNFILVKPGKEQAVATASMTPPAGGPDKGWMAVTADVIPDAYTKLLNPGESQTIKFTVTEAGDYPYICTFPGHYMTMKGVLKVTK